MNNLGFVGYGRFGRALLEMFVEHGYSVQAFDPGAEIPPEIAAPSLAALAAYSQVLFVAVPVSAMAETFQNLRAILQSHHIVVDVGSVKMAPYREMASTFGKAHRWVASHPLFGPVSLARAEAGLRVVICPNADHPDAQREIGLLYGSIGCKIVELDPETHDQIMAQTHALAFFVAKGMLDAGVSTDSPAAPPSFQAMARTIESVRGDAGHLLTTLHRENPFAADHRRRLLSALSALDRRLNESSLEAPAGGEDTLSISTPTQPPELSETRGRIDEVDQEILQLLLRRAELVRRAKWAKAQVGRGVVDPARESQMLAARGSWAEQAGLDPDGVRDIFSAIIAQSCEIQGGPSSFH